MRGLFFLLYGLGVVIFYFWSVEPYLQIGDLTAPRLLADSITYLDICRERISLNDWYWLRDAGPCISLNLLGQSVGLITLGNVLLMTIPAHLMARSYGVKSSSVLLILLINPMTFLSLFGPNKEVFGIACVMSLLIFLRTPNKSSLLFTLTFALFARLPMLAIVLFFLVISMMVGVSRLNTRPWRKFWIASSVFLLVTSFIALFIGEQAQLQILGDIRGADDNSISTLISLSLESYTANGLFVLTYIIRTVLNFFGVLPNLGSASFETHGIYYMIGVAGSSFFFLIMVFISAYRHGRHLIRINDEAPRIFLFILIFTMMLSFSPVIQHRYFYPLYPILILALVTHPKVRVARASHKIAAINVD